MVPHDELRAHTLELADKIGRKSPIALRLAKEAVRASQRLPLEEGLLTERDLFCLAFSTDDMKEGVRAFLEKRAPAFTGR